MKYYVASSSLEAKGPAPDLVSHVEPAVIL